MAGGRIRSGARPHGDPSLQAIHVGEELVATEAANGQRLDHFLAGRLPQFSRAHLQRAIEAGGIFVNHRSVKASQRLSAGDLVSVFHMDVPREGPKPQAIPLDIIFEDDDLAVVNKSAGMIVHPARGHWNGTLASALAHHFGQLSERGGPTRPGIVHRLDRDTSGVIVVAKTDAAHDALARQFQDRTAEKEYLAIVVGVPDRDSDIVNQPIGDHPTQRQKKAIRASHQSSRDATTLFDVIERLAGYSFLRARPKTGRTHQIRLHLAHIGCPVLCDRLYGGRSRITRGELFGREEGLNAKSPDEVLLSRHALHAHRLTIHHPATGELLRFEAPLPLDMEQVLELLRR